MLLQCTYKRFGEIWGYMDSLHDLCPLRACVLRQVNLSLWASVTVYKMKWVWWIIVFSYENVFFSCIWRFVTPWSLPGSSAHGILQARILGWVAISFSRESSRPRHWTQVSCFAGRFFSVWATREALVYKTCLMDSKLHKCTIYFTTICWWIKTKTILILILL